MIVALLRVQDGTKVAETSLKVTSPFRLGLVRPWEPQSRVTAKRKLTQQNIKPRLIIILTHDLIVIHWLKTDCHIGVATFVFFHFKNLVAFLLNPSPRWCKLFRPVESNWRNISQALNHAVFYYEARWDADVATWTTLCLLSRLDSSML